MNQVAAEDASGPLTRGGTDDIRTDAGSELQAMLGVGARTINVGFLRKF